MTSPSDSWIREFNEASKLADEISGTISSKTSSIPSGPETQRHFSASRRKITILRTRLETLESDLSKLPNTRHISVKEMNRRRDMLKNLAAKATQFAGALNMTDFANRDSLLGSESKSPDLDKTIGLDNRGVVGLQRQIIKEQDESLEKLAGTVTSTKHIALAVNEELQLHTHLLDDLDHRVDTTNSRLHRVQKNLAVLNKRTKGGCAWMCFSVIGIVILVVSIWAIIKYL